MAKMMTCVDLKDHAYQGRLTPGKAYAVSPYMGDRRYLKFVDDTGKPSSCWARRFVSLTSQKGVLQALKTLPFHWTRVLAGRVRTTENSTGQYYCPITALAKHYTGKEFEVSDWKEAAEVCQMPLPVAAKIVAAADHNTGWLAQRLRQTCKGGK